MSRLHQVRRDESDAPIVATMYGLLFDDRDPVDEPGTATGTPGDWWTVFANSPDVLQHAVQGFALSTLYLQHAVMSRALRTEFDDVDECIVEIRPEGAEDAILGITSDEEQP